MEIIKDKISIEKLKEISAKMFGNLVKAVVDVEKGVMAIGGELHADEETLLLESGSRQKNLWGINIYPEETGEKRIEFDSMINLRPAHGNRTREVDDQETREKIKVIVNKLLEK